MEFKPFPKIPRLSRTTVITEKIDGTNASILIQEGQNSLGYPTGFEESHAVAKIKDTYFFAASRQRWITPQDDNFGFAKWVKENADLLIQLGPGHHFGEWWGKGINRGYGIEDRRFSLFNTAKWQWSISRPVGINCLCVPILYEGDFSTGAVYMALERLKLDGSKAAPGFMDPEGIIIYHTAGNVLFKKTLVGDELGKSSEGHVKKERPPKEARDPNTGGRRKQLLPIDFPERRTPK